ncbi:MAG: ParB N-terminal domain-containing protein [Mangrovicoccus sp.]
MIQSKTPKVFRIHTVDDLARIPFENGMAAVEVPAELLDKLELKNEIRGDSARLRSLEKSIRSKGYRPIEPITARISKKGKWVVLNGGHRLTAARRILKEFWTNLFGEKVKSFYFVLFLTPDSWSKKSPPAGAILNFGDVDSIAESQQSWERADRRANFIQIHPPESES